MIDFLTNWIEKADTATFLLLNSLHFEAMDFIMFWITKQETWYVFYFALAVWIFYEYRGKGFLLLLMIVITIIITDQLTSSLMKPFFERLRPCHDPSITEQVHLVGGCGGLYGFASSHAANTFGLAMILYLLFGEIWKFNKYLFIWAAIVSYSRIYVGVHFPGDIIIGALLGVLAAPFVFFFMGSLVDTIKDSRNYKDKYDPSSG